MQLVLGAWLKSDLANDIPSGSTSHAVTLMVFTSSLLDEGAI